MKKVVGTKVKRLDAYEKVTGKAIYGDDINLPKMLHAAVRHADIPAGKILKIDTTKAKNLKGVVSVLLHDDIPTVKKVGPIRRDHNVIVKDSVHFIGDVIAIVAAETLETARKAADLIEIEYEEEQGIFDPREALKPESKLIHPEYKSNLVVHYPLRKGNVEEAFEKAESSDDEIIFERDYKTPYQEHAAIEPEVVIAEPNHQVKGVDVYGSIQNPFTTRKVVSIFTDLKLNQVNIIGSTMGGSFGGKDDIINVMACRAVALSLATNRPVKLAYTREQAMKEGYKRHPYFLNYKLAVNKNGKIKAMKINIVADSGAYSSQSFFVTWRSVVQATGPYEIENVQTDIKAAYTNKPYTAAFRGFGSPQIIFAQESMMDELANELGLTPYEIRKINGFKQGSKTASGQALTEHKVSLMEVIDIALEKADYHNKLKEFEKYNKTSRRFKKGIGFSCSYRGSSLGAEGVDTTSAIVSVQADGSSYIMTGLNENGQGLRTTYAMVVAETLGCTMEDIQFLTSQTANIADGGPTVASRGTIAGGNAVKDACDKIKANIFSVIKETFNVTEMTELVWADNKITNPQTKQEINFADAVQMTLNEGINTSAYGWWKSPDVSWDKETGQGNAYFTYVYGCQVAETQVDTSTGKIDMLNMVAAHDLGRVINRTGAEGQVYGGVAQGIGYGLLENYSVQNGIVKSENFDEYLLPTIKDIPNIDAILVENPDKYGPYGAKSLGEPTLELGAAAINNSVKFALKKKYNANPLTLERVFLGKDLVKKVRQSEVVSKERCEVPNINSKSNSETVPEKTTDRVSDINITVAKTLKEALEIMSNKKHWIISGGTDVIVQLRKEKYHKELLDISQIKELKITNEIDGNIVIGSACTFSSLIDNELIQKHYPLFIDGISLIGSTQIRSRATIGGNLVNAAPCADSVPSLFVYDASVKIESTEGSKIVKLSDFILGSYKNILGENEILTQIIIPIPKDKKYYRYFFKLGRRNALNITRMSIATMMSFDDNNKIDEVYIMPGSVFAKFQRLTNLEEFLVGKEFTTDLIEKVIALLDEKLESEIGGRWSSPYKIPVFKNMLRDALLTILEEK